MTNATVLWVQSFGKLHHANGSGAAIPIAQGSNRKDAE